MLDYLSDRFLRSKDDLTTNSRGKRLTTRGLCFLASYVRIRFTRERRSKLWDKHALPSNNHAIFTDWCQFVKWSLPGLEVSIKARSKPLASVPVIKHLLYLVWTCNEQEFKPLRVSFSSTLRTWRCRTMVRVLVNSPSRAHGVATLTGLCTWTSCFPLYQWRTVGIGGHWPSLSETENTIAGSRLTSKAHFITASASLMRERLVYNVFFSTDTTNHIPVRWGSHQPWPQQTTLLRAYVNRLASMIPRSERIPESKARWRLYLLCGLSTDRAPSPQGILSCDSIGALFDGFGQRAGYQDLLICCTPRRGHSNKPEKAVAAAQRR